MIEVQASSESARATIRQHLGYLIGQTRWFSIGEDSLVFTITEETFKAPSQVADFASTMVDTEYWEEGNLTEEQYQDILAAIYVLEWNGE
jgi:hypothetical protein